jgi:hypothetical protein
MGGPSKRVQLHAYDKDRAHVLADVTPITLVGARICGGRREAQVPQLESDSDALMVVSAVVLAARHWLILLLQVGALRLSQAQLGARPRWWCTAAGGVTV